MNRIKLFRRVTMVVALVVVVGCIILLLNFTAQNPTGRRYSSGVLALNGGSQAKGNDGERLLARDLKLPRNEDPDQLQCICNNNPNRMPPLNQCRICIAYSQSITQYRRPDFVTTSFIAEVKNREGMIYSQRDQLEQLSDYAIAARALGVPLWMYVRVDTNLDPEFERIIKDTGGGVVYYLRVPGWVDPVNERAKQVLPVALAVLVIFALWEYGSWRGPARRPEKKPGPGPYRPTDGVDDFMDRSRERARRTIDQEDARQDL